MAILHDPNLLLGTSPANTIDEQVMQLQTKLFGVFGGVPAGSSINSPFEYDGTNDMRSVRLVHGALPGTPPDSTSNKGLVVSNTSENANIRVVADKAGSKHACVIEWSASTSSPSWYPIAYISEDDMYHYGLGKYMSDFITLDDLPGGGSGVQAVIGGVGLDHSVLGDTVTLDITTGAGAVGKYLKCDANGSVMWDNPAVGGGGGGYYSSWFKGFTQQGAVSSGYNRFSSVTRGEYNGITISTTNGTCTLGYDGVYLVTASISGLWQSSDASIAQFLTLATAVNGSAYINHGATMYITRNETNGIQRPGFNATVQQMFDCTAGDEIDLWFYPSLGFASGEGYLAGDLTIIQVG